MSETDTGVDRARQVTALLYGEVVDHDDDGMLIEIPADMLGAAFSLFGQGGFRCRISGQQVSRQAERRVVSMAGHCVVCPGDMVTTSFYPLRIDLARRPVRVSHEPHHGAEAITRTALPPK